MVIVSPNVSNFDFEVTLDISQSTPKAIIEDISTYIGAGATNIIGINLKLLRPGNIYFHQSTYPPTVDIYPGLTDIEINLPTFNGEVVWGTYKIYATLIDQDGTQYIWTENGKTYKEVTICKPNTLEFAKGNLGGIGLEPDFDCDTLTLTVSDTTPYSYKGQVPIETDVDIVVTSPADTTGEMRTLEIDFVPFTMQFSLTGTYDVTGTIIQTYQFSDTTFVKAGYYYSNTFDVQCKYSLCQALCDYKNLKDEVKLCATMSPALAQDKQRKLTIISALIIEAKLLNHCGVDFGDILEEIRTVGGFECNCNCESKGVTGLALPVGAQIVPGIMCGDISMEVRDVNNVFKINLSDVSYSMGVEESIQPYVSFETIATECAKQFVLSIDFCAAVAAFGCGGGGGGSGTVTSFSAGNLSPLFTTSVATSTTTPALTFAAVSQNANLFYASPNGVAGIPTFRAIVEADLPATYWRITGNTIGNDNAFIGTIDNFDYSFYTNNISRARLFKTGELGVGITATPLAKFHIKGTTADNTASSFYAENSTSTHSLQFRNDGWVLRNGNLFSMPYSASHTSYGSNALAIGAAIIGDGNSAFGAGSLILCSTGLGNSGFGAESLKVLSSGTYNTATGFQALRSLTTASYNTADGELAGTDLTTGQFNTFVGGRAGYGVVDYWANSSIGYESHFGATVQSSIGLGYKVSVTASNQLAIGSAPDGFGLGAITHSLTYYSATGIHAEYFRTSTPESAQVGTFGDIAYVNTGAIGQVYVKQTGSATNTGWLALLTSGASGTIPAGTTGQTLYYAANGNVVTATSNLLNDGTNVTAAVAGGEFLVTTTTYTTGLLLVRETGAIVRLGDFNGTLNATNISLDDTAQTISYRANNGHTFQGDVSMGGKLTVTGAIDPTHLYLDEQAGDPANVANKGILYTKDVTGVTQLFYEASNATVTQISGAAAGANAALSNLASVSINTSLLAQTGVDLGGTATPFRDLYLFGSGTYATTYLKITGTPTGTRTLTIPDATDTIAVLATSQAFTNKTYNGLTLTSTTGTFTLTAAKTFSVTNTLTFSGTDGSTLAIGAGGTLGSNAYTSTAYAPLASPTFTGTVTIPTPFTLGAVSVTSTGTQLNFLNAATGTTGTTSTNIVFSTSPTLVTPALGVATATSINGLTITSSTGTFTLTNAKTFAVTHSLTLSGTDATVMTFPGASDTVAGLAAAQTFITGAKTFNSSILKIRNPADTFSYTIVGGANASDKNLTLPVITADDTFAVLGINQSFTGSQTFSTRVRISGQINGSSTAALTYRLTNGGGNVTPNFFINDVNPATSGNKSVVIDGTNGLSFIGGNASAVAIARASIAITNLVNTAGSESADLIFLTQAAGAAMAERLRISSALVTHAAGVGLQLAAGTTTVAPLTFVSGTNLTTAVAGSMEYNGTNLFFTRAGTVRENVLVAIDNVAAPATNNIGVILDYYGSSATRVLTTPNFWISVNVLGVTYKIPCYS